MGFFDKFKKKKETGEKDFSQVTSNEKAEALCEKNLLVPLYCMPLRFGGEDNSNNILYVPPEVVVYKDRYDAVVEKLLQEGKVSRYHCVPAYKGKSFVPCSLTIVASGNTRFTQTIQIW